MYEGGIEHSNGYERATHRRKGGSLRRHGWCLASQRVSVLLPSSASDISLTLPSWGSL